MTAHNKQVGGTHYSNLPIQPMEYALKNGLNFAQGNVVKYVTRYKDKGGIEDLHKAAHYIEVLIQHEIEQRQIADGWTPEAIDAAALRPEWPSEERIDAIGQNGPTAEHYESVQMLETPEDVVIPDWVEIIQSNYSGRVFGWSGEIGDARRFRHGLHGENWVIPPSLKFKRTPNGFELVLD